MRFEIKAGGTFAIVLGIFLLSGAVFVLGLWEGEDMGRQSQVSTEQMATAYPLTPEATESSPAAPSSEAGGAAKESSPEAAASTQAEAAATPPAPVAAATEARAMPRPPVHGIPRKRTASAEVPPPAEASVPPEESPGAAAPEEAGTRAPGEHTASIGSGASSEHAALPAVPRYRRHPYNIQIEAAMDRNGANSMAQRLQRLGYTPHLVPTLIAGQTWYKVEVGPYATQDEAAAAQEQLRQKYNSAYGGGGNDATKPAGAGGGNDDSGTVANPSAVANPSD
jgi:septal ring-binding cell division protein DamX